MRNKKKESSGLIVLKWIFISLGILLLLLFITPFLFKGKIENFVKETANKNLNAIVSFDDTSLSFFRNFPSASITVNNISVANKAPFAGDTLFAAQAVNVTMNITELFKSSNEAKQLKSITTNNGFVHIIFDKEGIGNYDIALQNETKEADTVSAPTNIKLDINGYQLENMRFQYLDRASKINLVLDSIYHSGNGNFEKSILDLDTKTEAFVSFGMDSVNYLNKVHVDLNAIIGIDIDNSKYSFKENIAHINKMPLHFEGFIQLLEENQLYDINFETTDSSFKNALALLPEEYSGNLEGVKTEGNFTLKGNVKGMLSEKTIPNFSVNVSAKNARFQYENLPKAVENITIDANIINKSGIVDDTYLSLNTTEFTIDQDVFSLNGTIKEMTKNPAIQLVANGTINLQNLSKAYPVALENDLTGILKANIKTRFTMSAIEKQQYSSINNSGSVSLSGFEYRSEELPNPFYIGNATLNFNPNTVQLTNFKASSGSTDIEVNGNLNNLYGFLFTDENLEGKFKLTSNTLKVDDFLSATETEIETDTDETYNIKVPDFLDVTLDAKANTVFYTDITLTNVSGKLIIKDETVTLQNINSNIFGGNIGFNGDFSTKNETSAFAMNLDLQKIQIADSFSHLSMLNAIAPISKAVNGKVTTKIDVSGFLKDDLTPDLQTISGDLFGKLLETKVVSSNSPTLNLLDNKLNFIDFSKLNLNNVSAQFGFKDGKTSVKPFDINYKDVKMTISGAHSFNNLMDYNIEFDVPVKYLGSSVTNALKKLSPSDASSIKSIPVKANLTGSFSSPSFSSNLSSATSNLMNTIIDKQKKSLINKGKDKLNNLLKGNKESKDSTKTKTSTEDKVKGVIKGLFGKKKGN
jgi:hypothetical protein